MNRYSLLVVALALLAAGCGGSPDRGEPVARYERDQVGAVQQVAHGEIVSVAPVDIDDIDDSGIELGTVIGAVAGGLAGRQVGGGSGRDIATVAGAVAGGYAGSRIDDDDVTEADGAEIGVELDDGREITVVQELDDDDVFRVGDEVRVVFVGDKARVEN